MSVSRKGFQGVRPGATVRNIADSCPPLDPNETDVGAHSNVGNAYGRHRSVKCPMRPEPRLTRRVLLWRGALAALLPWPADAAPVRPGAQIRADGIPVFERHALAAEAGELASLRFLDWHPLRAEMLVLRRHGDSQQLHRVAGAGTNPEPLTKGRDAVSSARWEPEAGDYLVFSRDEGGDEAFRLFRLTPGADPQPLTPAGERISEFEFLPSSGGVGAGLVCLQEQLNRESGAAATSRSSLWWLDPQKPESRRLIADVRGALHRPARQPGWPHCRDADARLAQPGTGLHAGRQRPGTAGQPAQRRRRGCG